MNSPLSRVLGGIVQDELSHHQISEADCWHSKRHMILRMVKFVRAQPNNKNLNNLSYFLARKNCCDSS